MPQKITPFLWFDNNAEEAVTFYMSIFKNSKILHTSRNGEGGSVLVMRFEIEGQEYMALNGGPIYKFNESISFMIDCETQEEVDYYWERLTDGGKPIQCGWLTDKFGLTWQVTPRQLGELMSDPDPAKSGAVMKAMMGMVKIEIAGLQAAYDSA